MRRESSLQAACVNWFRIQYPELRPLYISIPNGVPLGTASAAQFLREGLTAGAADTLLLVAPQGAHGLAIEYKVVVEEWHGGRRTYRKTYQSPEQKAWQAAVEKQGYKYAVVRTFEEFRDLVTGYLSPSRTMKAPELF